AGRTWPVHMCGHATPGPPRHGEIHASRFSHAVAHHLRFRRVVARLAAAMRRTLFNRGQTASDETARRAAIGRDDKRLTAACIARSLGSCVARCGATAGPRAITPLR